MSRDLVKPRPKEDAQKILCVTTNGLPTVMATVSPILETEAQPVKHFTLPACLRLARHSEVKCSQFGSGHLVLYYKKSPVGIPPGQIKNAVGLDKSAVWIMQLPVLLVQKRLCAGFTPYASCAGQFKFTNAKTRFLIEIPSSQGKKFDQRNPWQESSQWPP